MLFKKIESFMVGQFLFLAKYVSGIRQFPQLSKLFESGNLDLIATAFFLLGAFNLFIHQSLMMLSGLLFLNWTPAFRPGIGYNFLFIEYIYVIGEMLSFVVAYKLFQIFPKLREKAVFIVEKIKGPTLFLSGILMFYVPSMILRINFIAAIAVALLGLIAEIGLKGFLPLASPIGYSSQNTSDVSEKRTVLVTLLIGILAFSLFIGIRSWYPIHLPNDYIELPDTVQYQTDPNDKTSPMVSKGRAIIIDCFAWQEVNRRATKFLANDFTQASVAAQNGDILAEKYSIELSGAIYKAETPAQKIECQNNVTEQQLDQLGRSIERTSFWQSQAGRTLYHHSYLFVPAAHFLRYGLSSPIPYLYGFGNTIFHALLMKMAGTNLTGYFQTFPIAQVIGMLCIVGAVFYIAKEALVIPAALAFILISLWHINFDMVQMAPGFSPLRYAGLCLQLVSVFFLLRRPSIFRGIIFGATIFLSILWNKEFGMLGFVGQFLALLSLQLEVKKTTRIVIIFLALAVLFLSSAFVDQLGSGFLQTSQVGIFQIAITPMILHTFVKLCLAVLLIAIFAAVEASRFEKNEAAARYCILPVICLIFIKYIYNSAHDHFFFTTMIVFPFLLVFWNWRKGDPFINRYIPLCHRHKIMTYFVTSLVVLAFLNSVSYYVGAKKWQKTMTGSFVENSWNGLGEDFKTPIPASPIVDRMQSIQKEIKPDDVVLFLSPFDHLMSFYGNPQHYCSHFEIMTNLVTYKSSKEIVQCVKDSPNILVVYDDALNVDCPILPVRDVYEYQSCEGKHLLKAMINDIFKQMEPDLKLEKKVGVLSFYRKASAMSLIDSSKSQNGLHQTGF